MAQRNVKRTTQHRALNLSVTSMNPKWCSKSEVITIPSMVL